MYYVYYRSGSCNDGSCEHGMVPCDSEDVVKSFIEEYNRIHCADDPEFTVVKGELVSGKLG